MSKFIDYFIEQYEPDTDRMGFSEHPLRYSNGIESEHVIADDDSFYRISQIMGSGGGVIRKVVADDYVDTHFFELLCFLDKYRAEEQLPNVKPRKYDNRTAEDILTSMNLILKPIVNYDDFIERLELADKKIPLRKAGASYLDLESFNGECSSDVALSGKSLDVNSEYRLNVEYSEELNHWRLYRKERGKDITNIKIYDIENVYLFLLNFHIRAV